MVMNAIGVLLPGNRVFEIAGLYPVRRLGDGLTVFEFKINFDRYVSDHTPKFSIQLLICNINVLEISVYQRGRP